MNTAARPRPVRVQYWVALAVSTAIALCAALA
jgi:hypothetical protein